MKNYSVWHVAQFGLKNQHIGNFDTLEKAKSYAVGQSYNEAGIFTVCEDDGDLDKVPGDIPPIKQVYEIERGQVHEL